MKSEEREQAVSEVKRLFRWGQLQLFSERADVAEPETAITLQASAQLFMGLEPLTAWVLVQNVSEVQSCTNICIRTEKSSSFNSSTKNPECPACDKCPHTSYFCYF